MMFIPNKPKKKPVLCYRTLYITQVLVDQINQIAKINDTSFDQIVISMIEHCLEENDEEKGSPSV